jgi:RNase P/RNase MRP subunit p30
MGHRFFDLNIEAKNWKEIMKRAKDLELVGICLVINSKENLEEYHKKIEEIKKEAGLEIIKGILIDEDKDKIIKVAKKNRKDFELILVRGGSYEINRIACSSDYIDILSNPGKGRKDCGIDHICCKDAKEHNVTIELNFRELLKAQGMNKIRELNKMKEILRLCKRFNTNFIVNSGAKEICELRGGRELAALSYSLGASLEEALFANSEFPSKLIQKNREKILQPLRGVSLENYGR